MPRLASRSALSRLLRDGWVSGGPPERYEIRFQPAARRAIGQRLPEAVAAAVLEFCESPLAVSLYPVGKPLFGPLAGCHGAECRSSVLASDGNACHQRALVAAITPKDTLHCTRRTGCTRLTPYYRRRTRRQPCTILSLP